MPLPLILQNLMFSLPHEASLLESMGLNFKHRMLKSDVYLATISGFSPRAILVMSHTIIISLLCASFPVLARYFPSYEKAKHFRVFTGMITIEMHLPVAYSQILMMEFFPS